jgi:outer membrane murein-binding lipoprotein Lpp
MSLSTGLGVTQRSISRVHDINMQIARLNEQKFAIAQQAQAQQAQGGGANEQLKEAEKRIDQQLEELKAMRTAMESEKQEFQKYVSENIKNTFKNSYA